MSPAYETNTDTVTDGEGNRYPDCLIIDRPDLKSMPLVLGEGALTIIFWGFWFYLWLPLVSLLAWGLGFQILHKHMVALGGFDGVIEQLHVFTSGVALVSGAIALWGFYNYKRYGRYTRRNITLAPDMDKLAAGFNMPTEKLAEVQQAKHLAFSFADDDSITKIDLSPAPLP